MIAWRFALRGHRIALIEPTGPGNAGSGSGDRSRIVRALYDDRGFAAAGHLGLALWSAWSAALGAPLVERTGVVYFDRRGDDEAVTSFRSSLDRGVAHEGLCFVGGMSGHGFKHAPSLGESVAQLVVGETPVLDLAAYRLRT